MKFSFEEPHVWMQHALCLVAMGQYARALSVLKEASRLLPSKVIPCLLAARICYEHLNQVMSVAGSLCSLLEWYANRYVRICWNISLNSWNLITDLMKTMCDGSLTDLKFLVSAIRHKEATKTY